MSVWMPSIGCYPAESSGRAKGQGGVSACDNTRGSLPHAVDKRLAV
jgi:hypothetical protein